MERWREGGLERERQRDGERERVWERATALSDGAESDSVIRLGLTAVTH